MNGSINLPLVGRVDKRSLVAGVVITVGLLTLPVVSKYTGPYLAKIADFFQKKK